jgi:hypothetical protein
VFALGQDRPFVASDLLDGPAGAIGHLFGGQSRADQRLHLPGTHPTVDLDLELTQAWPVPSGGSAEGLVEEHAKSLALGIGQQQVLAVLMDTDQP